MCPVHTYGFTFFAGAIRVGEKWKISVVVRSHSEREVFSNDELYATTEAAVAAAESKVHEMLKKINRIVWLLTHH